LNFKVVINFFSSLSIGGRLSESVALGAPAVSYFSVTFTLYMCLGYGIQVFNFHILESFD